MALSLRGITLGGGRSSLGETLNSLGDTLSGYFVRYRLALYLLSAVAVALALQLLLLRASESMGNHDSNVVGAGRVG